MPISVQHVRLSFIWVNTNLTMLSSSNGPAFLRDWIQFADRFDAVRNGAPDSSGLGPPWGVHGGEGFWTCYLENRDPHQLDGRRAWRSVVPFRLKSSVTVQADWLPGGAIVEGFLYPHAYAVAIHVNAKPANIELTPCVDLAVQVR